jgi:hypothetical protein
MWLSPKGGWISDGRQVLQFKTLQYDLGSQDLKVTDARVDPQGSALLLKRRRKVLAPEEVIQL